MKKIVLLAFMLVLLSTVMSLCVVGFLGLRITYALPYTDINVETANNMITNGSYPDLVILDVRRQDEYDNGHIYGAVWIPHTELDTRISELAGHENHEIIVYCRTGVRSVNASETLDSYNFTRVYNMLGGITAWQSEGYEVSIATVHNVNTTFNYDTIQAAIDAPQTLGGHTILVDTRIYYEHVVVTKSLSLIGENKHNTIIDGNGTGTVVEITANNVNISGFMIQNGFWGIDIGSSNNVLSSNNVASNKRVGILPGGSNNTLRDNNITSSQLNLYLYSWASDKEFNHDIDPSNTIDGKPIYWLVNKHNQQIPHNAGYVVAVNCTNITVRNLNLQKNIHGVFFVNTNHSTVENVSVLDTVYGVFLRNSNNNTMYNNTILGSLEMQWGIWLWGSGNNVSFNTFKVENGAGVFTDQGSENAISKNNFEYCAGGIRGHSKNTIIYSNHFIFNDVFGILCWSGSSNTSISENTIISSGQGIIVQSSLNNSIYRNNINYNDYGIVIISSSNNTFYNNNFIGNTRQIDVQTSGSANFWDNGVEGNYWSNYTGVDSDHDGIGDSNHVLNANNTDHYPLMGMFHSFNTSLGYHVNVISNSTIEHFQYFESNSTIGLYVSNMTTTQTFGFGRVCIPKSLMPPPYTVIIDDGLIEALYFNGTVYDNSTHRWIYFAYGHSTRKVDIVPEFPTWTSMLLVLIGLTVVIAIYKRRLHKTLMK